MNWLITLCLAGAGGATVSVVAFTSDIFSWYQTRRAAHLAHRSAKRAMKLPALRIYVDPWPEVVVLITRIILGLIAAAIFKFQVTTPLAAIAVGSSAPALLAQLGNGKAAQAANDVTEFSGDRTEPATNGTQPVTAASIPLTEPEMPEPGGVSE